MHEETVVHETLWVGINLFQEGRWPEAVSYFDRVLTVRTRVPSYRLAAACLAAECHRGQGDFSRAEQYYQLAIDESETVTEKHHNDWYTHYRPRAQFGLITVLRRTLSDEHDRIAGLIAGARELFQTFASRDLPAQVCGVEGLYCRQLGDIPGSVRRIVQGIQSIDGLPPPYLFLSPEHLEALLALTYLCSDGSAVLASDTAARVFTRKCGPWSTAVAAATMLHIHFQQRAEEMAERTGRGRGRNDEVEGWFRTLNRAARQERDPLLLSEDLLLRVVRAVEAGDRGLAEAPLKELGASLDVAPLALVLLRGVEVGVLAPGIFGDDGWPAEVGAILERGIAALNELQGRLVTYRFPRAMADRCRAVLGGAVLPGAPLELWSSEPVRLLRCRAWP
jgi:hypothetical protein